MSVAVDGVSAAGFLTLVVPMAASASPPRLRAWPGATTGAHVLEITGVGAQGLDRDRIVWNGAREAFELGGFHGCAVAAWIRESPTGAIRTFTACDVVEATGSTPGQAILPPRPQPARWVRWDAAQDLVEVSGEDA